MSNQIELMSKYHHNKNISDCMTGKEVRQFTYDLKKQIKKRLREEERWRKEKMRAASIKYNARCDFEVKWRKEEREGLQIIFNSVESQIKGWYAA